jgi:1,2-phenylacetyl-CoA epoxidase PaaB subunit
MPRRLAIGSILAKNARIALRKARDKFPRVSVHSVKLQDKKWRSGLNRYIVYRRA